MSREPSAQRMPVVFMRDVTRAYPSSSGSLFVLKGIDLLVERGEYVAVTGPSGSGKSTLLSCLGCLDRPTAGRYLFEGLDVLSLDDDAASMLRNRRIGFVFQAYNLLPQLTARENVELPLVYAGVHSRERRDRAAAALERFHLSEREDFFPEQLSGGERQRVAIARAIVSEPALVLADEPTGALDAELAKEVVAALEDLRADGTTVVLVTHDAALARRAERRLQILDGVITSDDRR